MPIKIGYLIKSFGNKGQLSVSLEEEAIEDILIAKYILVPIKGNLVPYFIETYDQEKELIKLESIKGPEMAKSISDRPIYVLDKDINVELSPQLELSESVIGFKVYDQDTKFIGVVENVLLNKMQQLLLVKRDGNSVLLPVDDALIVGFESEKKMIILEIIEGLLDL